MTDVIRFAPHQTLPPGYRVVWRESDEMYCWERSDEVEGPACCCRFMARRMAWANYRRPESEALLAELEATEARAARLRAEIAAGPCREYGHDWQFTGEANAGCAEDCACSVPVHVCAKCGDCDYGDNAEAEEIRAGCEL